MRRRWLLLKEHIENFKDPKYRTISVLGIDEYNKQQESYFNLLKKIEDNKILKDENSLAQNLKNYAAAELTHATQGPASVTFTVSIARGLFPHPHFVHQPTPPASV